MTVPYTFANATGFIPLAELDANFASVPNYANTANVVIANAQPNITSLGTLSSVSISGNIVGGKFYGDGGNLANITVATIPATALTGNTLSFNVYFSNLQQVGNLGNLSVIGNINTANLQVSNVIIGNVIGNVLGALSGNVVGNLTGNVVGNLTGTVTGNITGTAASAGYAATVTSNSQPNITSVGILQVVSTTGNIRGGANASITGTITVGNVLTGGLVSATGNLTSNTVLTNSILTDNYLYANGIPLSLGNVTSSNVSYTAPYTNAIATTVYNKIKPIINVVADYGADPTGVADSSTAFQNALTVAGTAGGAGGYGGGPAVYIPPGTYKVNSQLTVYNNTTIFGDSQWNTVINTNTTGTLFYGRGRTDSTIRGLTLQQTGSKGTSRGIDTGGGFFWNFEDLNVYGFNQAFYTFQSVYHTFTRCNFEQCNYGVYCDGNSGQWNVDWYNNVYTFINCRFFASITGIYGYLCEASIINCDVSSAGTVGIYITGTSSWPAHGIVIDNLYAEAATNVMSFYNARVSLSGYYFDGTSVASSKIINASTGTQVQVGVDGYCLGGFSYGAYATTNSRVILNTNFTNAGTNFADGTSSIKYFAYGTTPG